MTGAPPVDVSLVETLAGLTDDDLRTLEDGPHPFFGRYLRLIEEFGVARLIGGGEICYLVARRDRRVVAVCPVLEVATDAVHAYSLRKTFFERWDSDLERLAPGFARWLPIARRATSLYARAVELTGAPVARSLVAVAPLTYRGGIGGGAGDDREVAERMLEGLLDLGRQRGLVLSVVGVPGTDEKRRLYRSAQMTEVFQFRDHYLDLPGSSLEDWLAAQSSHSRNKRRRELKQFARAGLTITHETEIAPFASRLSELYEATYGRYSSDHFHHPPEFLERLATLPTIEVLVARQGADIVGFTLLALGQDATSLRVGEPLPKVPHVFFSLVFYEPMRRAYATGRRRLWLGPGNSEVKLERGAQTVGLYSYFAFPNRRSRLLVAPYITTYSRIANRVTSVDQR